MRESWDPTAVPSQHRFQQRIDEARGQCDGEVVLAVRDGGGELSVGDILGRGCREGLRERQPSGSCFSGDGHLVSAAIDGLCECQENKVHEVLHGFHTQLSSGSP